MDMDNAITSTVTRETANAYADFIATLCEPPARPVLQVIEGGKSETPANDRGEGAKYDSRLNVVEIAKRIRADIKAEPPARPVLQVIEGGKSETPANDRGEGAKYDSRLNVVEIAKRIRADIKAAIASGEIPAIKTSVRISRYSMGRSIDVTITEAPFEVINPAWTEAYKAGARVWDLDGIGKFTTEATRVFDVIKSIRAAYNYDRSDSMTDYYDVNFGGSVSYDWKLTN